VIPSYQNRSRSPYGRTRNIHHTYQGRSHSPYGKMSYVNKKSTGRSSSPYNLSNITSYRNPLNHQNSEYVSSEVKMSASNPQLNKVSIVV
jgi:hypothetical protein